MTIHASKILCLVPSSTALLRHAVFLTGTLGATLHVLPFPTPASRPRADEDLLRLVEDATTDCADIPSIIIPNVRITETDDILQYVADHEIDLVVTDTPNSDGPVPPLSNTPTELLLERLTLPVFLTAHRKEPASIDRIVAPTDFSAHSLDALRHAASLARLYDVPIDVPHVIESIPYVGIGSLSVPTRCPNTGASDKSRPSFAKDTFPTFPPAPT